MKIATMRRVDRWLGVPACFFLTIWRALTSLFQKKPPDSIRSIVFIKLAEQGSTVLAYPAIRRAVERVGRENVYFVVFETTGSSSTPSRSFRRRT